MLTYNGKRIFFLILKIYNLVAYKNDLKWKIAHDEHGMKPNSKINHMFKIQGKKQGSRKKTDRRLQ